LHRQAARFSRPLCHRLPLRRRRLPLHRAIDTTSLGASAASLDTAPSLSPSPTPSFGDPAFSLDAVGGVPIVVPNSVAVPDLVAPSPTSSPTPSLCTACTRCMILLPPRPPSALMAPCRTTQRCIDATEWGPVGQMWTCARGGEGSHERRHVPPSCPGLSLLLPCFSHFGRSGGLLLPLQCMAASWCAVAARSELQCVLLVVVQSWHDCSIVIGTNVKVLWSSVNYARL
jgi:hypothetical protein